MPGKIRLVRNDDVHQWLSTGALFLKMSGNFLRLIQALPGHVAARLPEPMDVSDESPSERKASEELMDYCLRNYKANQSANVVDNLDFNSDDENDSSLEMLSITRSGGQATRIITTLGQSFFVYFQRAFGETRIDSLFRMVLSMKPAGQLGR